MSQNLQQTYAPSSSALSSRNRVLRNTYWLLALSMLPTIGGAWLGVQMDFSFFRNSPLIGFMAFMAVAFGFFYAIEQTKNTGWGVLILLGFTFFMGLMLSRLIGHTLIGYTNGASLIMMAFGGTASVFAVMASIATVSKRDFSNMGKWLFAGVVVLLLASLANVFLQIPALYLAVSVIAIAIFSAYILYDVQQIINGGETNYISATLRLYLDVYNIFVNLLSLLGIFGGNRN
ncbi:Bax inhibitor-1/YccA family protein [Paraherbaspirillum soli]|uniref:Bax inhibitor-1/YccA family protein n=1 Tax=Paraherbaspirillum soli TaxID=631222 RepID=A0ABW0MCX3_9BURK